MALHVYRNDVTEWFVAESLGDAVEVAREYLGEVCEMDPAEMDLDFSQEPDNKPLTMDDDGTRVVKSAAEWAAENGKGFLMTTEY